MASLILMKFHRQDRPRSNSALEKIGPQSLCCSAVGKKTPQWVLCAKH